MRSGHRLLDLLFILSLLVTGSTENVCEINNNTFRCLNGRIRKDKTFCPEIISASKVRDGICDCCDGSDESNMTFSNLTAIFQQDSITYNSFLCNKIVERVEFHDDVAYGRPRCFRERQRDVEISMKPQDGVLLRPTILGGTNRSISFWTIFPFNISKHDMFTAVGGTASKMSSHVSVKRNRVGFLRSNLEFVDLGLDISSLSRGWYHVRLLTSSSSTSLYLNDELVSTSQEIQRDAVGTIGSKNKMIASWPSPMRHVKITRSNSNNTRIHSDLLLDHVFVINLLESTDRYADMQRILQQNGLTSISSRFVAIPGMSIRKSPPLFKLVSRLIRIGADGGPDGSFEGKGAPGKTVPIGRPPKAGSRDEVMWWNTLGCFASHTELWRRLAERPEGRYLIMEDDARLRKGWRQRLSTIFESNLIPDKDWDILYLTNFGLKIHSWPPWRGHVINDHVVKLGPAKDNARNLGMIAYIVRGGPRMLRMLKSVRSIGALNLDVAINLRMDEISAYLVLPEVKTTGEGNLIVTYYASSSGVSSTRGAGGG